MAKELNPITGLEDDKFNDTEFNIDTPNQPSFKDTGFAITGVGYSQKEKYGSNLGEDFNITVGKNAEDIAARNQSTFAKASYGVGRFVGKVATEVLKMPGYVGGAVGSGIDGIFGTQLTDSDNFAGSVADNAWINAFESLDESIKESMPVHVLESVRNGNLWDNIWSSGFWATEGSDGLGYLTSMLVPGSIVRGLGAGSKIAKGTAGVLSRGQNITNKVIPLVKPTTFHGTSKALFGLGFNPANIDLGIATGLSTMFEAAAEAGGTMDHLKQSLLPQLESGQITKEEYDSRIALAGKDIFNANLGILVIPNLITNKMLLGRFKPNKKLSFSKDGTINPSKLTTRSKIYKTGSSLIANIGREGFLEEGLQSTVEGMISDKAEQGERYNFGEFISNLGGAYLDMIGTTEGQKAVFLGSIMGGTMGVYSHIKQRKANTVHENKVINALNENINLLHNHADIYKKDENGNVIVGKDSKPELDGVKFQESLKNLSDLYSYSGELEVLNQAGKKELYDNLLNKLHLNLAMTFSEVENGKQGLREVLEDKKAFFNIHNGEQNLEGNNITNEEYISNIESLVDQVKKDSQVYNDLIEPDLNLESLSDDQELIDNFKSNIKRAYINSLHTVRELKKEISTIDALINDTKDTFNITDEDSSNVGIDVLKKLQNKKESLEKESVKYAEQLASFSTAKNIESVFSDRVEKITNLREEMEEMVSKVKEKESTSEYNPLADRAQASTSEQELDAIVEEAKSREIYTPLFKRLVEQRRGQIKADQADKDLTPEGSQNRKEKESVEETINEFNTGSQDMSIVTDEEAANAIDLSDFIGEDKTSEDTVDLSSFLASDEIQKQTYLEETAPKSPVVEKVYEEDPYISLNRDKVFYKIEGDLMILSNAGVKSITVEQAIKEGHKFRKNTKNWAVLLDKNYNPIDSPSKKDTDYLVDADYINDGNVIPGDDIKFQVRRNSTWNKSNKVNSDNLLIELLHNGVVVGILPSYKGDVSHPESFRKLRNNIYKEYSESTEDVLVSNITVKSKGTLAGRVFSSKTKSNPINVLNEGEQLILATVVDKGGDIDINYNNLSGTNIKEDDIYTSGLITPGRSYMLIKSPNNNYIPYQIQPSKLNSIEGTKEKIENIIDSFTSDNWKDKKKDLMSLTYIPELRELEFDKGKDTRNTFGIPGKKLHGLTNQAFKKYLFDDLNIMKRYFNIDSKKINTGEYNKMISNEGRITTDLNPYKHFHSATVAIEEYVPKSEIKKELPKETSTVKEVVESLPKTKAVRGAKQAARPKLKPKKGGSGSGLGIKDGVNKTKQKEKSSSLLSKNEELSWFKSTFPEVELQVLEDLKHVTNNDVDAWGMFKNSIVYIHENSPKGTTYHEAFHVVFRMFTSSEQRAKLYEEAADRFEFDQTKFDVLKKAHPSLSKENLNLLYLEEVLADEYQNYQLNINNNGNLNDSFRIKKYLGEKIVEFFKKLYRFFTGTRNKMLNIDEMFSKISKGEFRKNDIVRNTSTLEPAYSIRTEWSNAKVETRINLVNTVMINTIKEDYMEDPSDYNELQKVLASKILVAKPNQSIYAEVFDKLMVDAFDLQDVDDVYASEELFNLLDEMFVYEVNDENEIDILGYRPFMYDIIMNLRKWGIKVDISKSQINAQTDSLENIEENITENSELENWQKNSLTVNPKDNLSGELKMIFSKIPSGKDDISFTTFHDGNSVFNTILSKISNSDSVETMIKKLENSKEDHDFVESILNSISSDSKLKSQLFQIAQKVNLGAKVIFESTEFKDGDPVTTSKVINANDNTINQIIIDDLYNLFSSSRVLDVNLEIKSENLVSKEIETLDEILKFFKKDDNKKLESAPKDKIDSLYTTLNNLDLVLSKDHFNKIGKNKKEFVNLVKTYKSILNYINKKSNPFIDQTTILNKLASSISKVEPNYYQSSYRNMDNETVQSVVYPFFAAKQFNMLNGINQSPEELHNYRVQKFKDLRKSDTFLSTAPILKPEMYDNSYINDTSGVFEFANLSGIRKKNISKGKSYTSMTKGDLIGSYLTAFDNNGSKTHGWYGLPILADAPVSTLVKLKKLSYEEVINDLYYVAHQEYNRILEVKEKLKDEDSTKFKNRDSENQGLKFHFITNLEESDFIGENKKEKIKAKIDTFLNDELETFKDYIESIELPSNLVNDFIIKSYVANDFLAKTQLISLTSGDPAYYKNSGDFFKRNKQINSPGMYINSGATFSYTGGNNKLKGENITVRPHFNTIFLTDSQVPANFKDELEQALVTTGVSNSEAKELANKYNVTEESDAQAYITLDRWVEIQIGLGRYDNSAHEAVSRLKSGKATSNDVNLVMQPIKPFYFGHVDIDGTLVPMQNKNSEYVLLREFANKSPQLSKLLDFMEENNVSSAQFESAIKVGLHNKVEVDNLSNLTPTVKLNNNDYRVQMETPAHFIESQSLLGTQLRKLILGDLNLESVYDKSNGMTGQELIDKVDEILVKTITDAFNETVDEIKNSSKLNDILKEEILDRDLGERYLKAVELDKNGEPTLQYYHPFLSKQSQSLFNSIFKTAVAKTKINGGALYNLSSYGFTDDLTVKFNEDGGIDYFECMVPPKAIFGKNIPKEFLNESDEIDINKVPEKLLRGISYRIPTEDKYSMFNIKVAGFLPNNGAIMLPTGATTIAGLDFDIDKMFNMFYNYDKSSNEVIESSLDTKMSRDNYLIDLFTLVKQHPSSLKPSMDPGGFETLRSVVEKIKTLKGLNKENLNPASINSNLDIFERNMAGKALIGIFANHNASHAILQHGNINIKKDIINFDGDYSTSISDVTDAKGGLITRNIAEFLAAVVDNAKDPLAGFSNINTYTADVVSMMLHNGRSIDTALAFINQPIIIDFIEKYYNYGASKQAETKALKELKVDPVFEIRNSLGEYTTSELFKGIKGIKKTDYTEKERAVLQDFLSLKLVASEVSSLVNAVKIGDGGVGPSMGHNESKINKWNEAKNELTYISGQESLMNSDKSFVAYYEKAIKESNDVINEVAKYPFNSGFYTDSKESIQLKVASSTLSVQDLNNINESIMSFIASDHEFFNNEEVQRILTELPSTLSDYQKNNPNSEYNNLVKYLKVKVDKDTNTRVIEYRTVANDSLQQDNASKAWESMLLNGNLEERKLALDLFKYNYGRAGFRFTRNSFSHIAPIEIYNYIEGFRTFIDNKVEELNNDDSRIQINAFINQYVANNFANLNYIPKFTFNSKNVNKKDSLNSSNNVELKPDGSLVKIRFSEDSETKPFVKFNTVSGIKSALPFIKHTTYSKKGGKSIKSDTLFKLNREESSGVKYLVYDAVTTPKKGTISYQTDNVNFELVSEVKSEEAVNLEKFDATNDVVISLEDFLNNEEQDPFKPC